MDNIIQIKSLPGVKRDGTKFEGDQYVDARWCRFQRNLPRKIWGYRSINKFLREISTALHSYSSGNAAYLNYVHTGSPNFVERFFIDSNNNVSIVINRTPEVGFTPDDDNMWCFEVDGNGSLNYLIAQVAPNADNMCNAAGGKLFYGSLLGTEPLVPITLPTQGDASGGVVALHPYTFMYGANGYVAWSVAGNPTDFSGAGSGAAYITGQKIIKGLPIRGGAGASPSGLFWSADSLVRAYFVGGAPVFAFDTIATGISILSQNCVVEYDGIFYWPTTSRFTSFNGVVREIPNDMNTNYFFDGVNLNARQKVFGFKVPRFGEIWWCYPRGDATECTHAVIHNVRENTWYDTPLPNSGRSAAVFNPVYGKPLLTGVDDTPLPYQDRVTEARDRRVTEDGSVRITQESEASQYKLWVHETGLDEVDGQDVQPILSYFETADISLPATQGINKSLSISMMEPDFVQKGDLTVTVKGRTNARAPEENGDPVVIPETPSTSEEQVNHFKTERRELRFRFDSNVIGGDYQMGLVLAHVTPSDGRVTT